MAARRRYQRSADRAGGARTERRERRRRRKAVLQPRPHHHRGQDSRGHQGAHHDRTARAAFHAASAQPSARRPRRDRRGNLRGARLRDRRRADRHQSVHRRARQPEAPARSHRRDNRSHRRTHAELPARSHHDPAARARSRRSDRYSVPEPGRHRKGVRRFRDRRRDARRRLSRDSRARRARRAQPDVLRNRTRLRTVRERARRRGPGDAGGAMLRPGAALRAVPGQHRGRLHRSRISVRRASR